MCSPRHRASASRTPDRPDRSARFERRATTLICLALALAAAAAVSGPAPVAAQTCDRSGCGWIACGTPATPVPSNGGVNWGSSSQLQPAESSIPIGRDVTLFNEFTGAYQSNPYYFGVDIQNGWAFTVTTWGVKVWDVSTSPVPSTPTGTFGYGQFLNGGDPNENKTPVQDISLPPGNDTIGIVAAQGRIGATIIDFTSKSQPRAIYQNFDVEATAAYAATIGGTNYGFIASATQPGGLLVYNLDAARRNAGCAAEDGTSHTTCPGVYVGQVGTRAPSYVAGVDHFVVASSGASVGYDLWDVANPGSPTLKLSGFQDRSVYGVAMWKIGASYYLGAFTGPNFANPSLPFQLNILDVSCAATSCAAGPVLKSQTTLNVTTATTQSYFVTFSFSGTTPYLYIGSDQVCGVTTPQREWLMNVANPSAPQDITPATTTGGGYWGWYYRANSTGFNYVMPRKGKFNGTYFYRAAQSLFDVHKQQGQSIPTAEFSWSPNPAYLGAAVQFTDLSSGQPNSWSWTFQNGSPSTALTQNPSVTFSQLGPQNVTLISGNGLGGSTPVTHSVNVLNPAPQVGSVTVSPSSPLQCQPVTVTANNVTGEPPLTFAWTITNNGNGSTAPGGTSAVNPFVWDTKANAVPPGSYTAKVQVSGTGSPATAQAGFTLGSLPSLPASFAPTNDAFTASAVQFHVAASGATEWNWSFGDLPGGGPAGDGYSGWTNDPANGPNPLHTYSAAGTYTVTVKVRNCTTDPNGLVSSPLSVQIVVALVASFQPVCSFAPCVFVTNSPITFIDSSVGAAFWDYAWDFTGTGTPNFSDNCHTSAVTAHTYTTAGHYTPVVRVHGPGGSCGTGSTSFTVSPAMDVEPGSPPPPPVITVSGPGSGVQNTPYTFFASAANCTPAATWSWTANGATVSGSATGSSITVSYASVGNYSVSATNSGCGSAFGSVSINISSTTTGGTLNAAFSISPASPSVGSPAAFNGSASTGASAYAWYFGDGGQATGVTATHTYSQTGTYTVKLDVSAPGNGPSCQFGVCVSEAVKTINVGQAGLQNLNSDFTESPGTCTNTGGFWFCPAATGVPTTLTGAETNAAASFAWDFGDGTKGSGNPVTHTWAQPGNPTVTLTVSGTGFNTTSTSKTFDVTGSGEKTFGSDFDESPGGCTNTGGFGFCPATAGLTETLTGSETSKNAVFAWDFGDGTKGSGNPVTHAWPAAGTFTVTLSVTGSGEIASSTSKTFQVAAPTTQSVVLPWVAATRGALVQSCDLYLHNPGANPVPVTLQFRKRGTVDVNPPQATAVIQPGATVYAPDVLQTVFSRDNIAGFVTVTVKSTDPLPVVTSFNTVTRTDGSQFGQTVPGLSVPFSSTSNSSTPSSTFQYLAGLNDNSDQLAYFGISNPTPTTTTYHVRLFDTQGNQIGESNGDLTLGPFGQRQFQQADVHNLFGLKTGTDYLVSIENKSGNTIFPYGENVRMGSGDPSFVTAGNTSAATQYVIGAFSTNGSWQTDVVLANTSTQPMSLSLTFTRTGVTAPTTAPVTLTLNPGDTQRLSNAIAGKWNLSNVVGVITVTSTGAGGIYPIVQAESYNNAQPANRYGQTMTAFSDANQAKVGQAHYLVGLRQDANHLATVWVFNNSTTDVGLYDVVYRGLDGTVLGTVSNLTLLPGKVKGLLPNQHPLPAGGVTNGFTVQVVVKNGTALSAAQVLTTSTGDPAYVQGAAR
jgi:PKD repeat protein